MKPSLKTVLTTLAVLAGLAWSATAPQAQLAPPKPAVPALLPPPKAPNPPPQVNMGPKTPVAPAATAVATPNLSAVVRDDNGSTVNILPGTLLRLTGTSLANADRVHFAWPGGGADAQPDPGRPNSDTTLYVLAPQATFANTLAVQATVSRGRLTSQAVRFEMKPVTVVKLLTPTELQTAIASDHPNGNSLSKNVSLDPFVFQDWLLVEHKRRHPSDPWPLSGDDIIFPQAKLRNGWGVISVEMVFRDGFMYTGPQGWVVPTLTLTQQSAGTSALLFKVHWEAPPAPQNFVAPPMGKTPFFQYKVRIKVAGPQGMPAL